VSEQEARALWGKLRSTPVEKKLPEEVWHRLEDQQRLADPELAQSIEEMRQGKFTEL